MSLGKSIVSSGQGCLIMPIIIIATIALSFFIWRVLIYVLELFVMSDSTRFLIAGFVAVAIGVIIAFGAITFFYEKKKRH
jgi:hypothetical protein